MKKILIIDDDSRNIFALTAVLRAKGFHCVAAASAIEGIRILDQDPEIGIILMDMMMPEMDGYEAISNIKANPKTAGIPVIAVTAQAMVGDKEKCLNAGATGYVAKPIDIDILKDLLDKNLN